MVIEIRSTWNPLVAQTSPQGCACAGAAEEEPAFPLPLIGEIDLLGWELISSFVRKKTRFGLSSISFWH